MKQKEIGNINDCDSLEDKKFTNFEYINACPSDNCPLIPICGGGCRFEAYLSTGSFSKPHCQKEYSNWLLFNILFCVILKLI